MVIETDVLCWARDSDEKVWSHDQEVVISINNMTKGSWLANYVNVKSRG